MIIWLLITSLNIFVYFTTKSCLLWWILHTVSIGPPGVPRLLAIVHTTAHTANISWVSGRDGGFTQIFQVHYEEADGSNPIQSAAFNEMGTGLTMNFTIMDLKENTDYRFKIVSSNESPELSQNTAETDFTTFKTRCKIHWNQIISCQISITFYIFVMHISYIHLNFKS